MTETPRMPNFWWCPTHHLYRGGAERPCADAVKLGDVERAEAETRTALHTLKLAAAERDEARAKLDRFTSRLGAELDEWAERDPSWHPLIDSIRALDPEATK